MNQDWKSAGFGMITSFVNKMKSFQFLIKLLCFFLSFLIKINKLP